MGMLTLRNTILFMICFLIFQGRAQADPPADYEGFGVVTNGALDSPEGYEVYHVTTLDDSKMYVPGSLRYAVFREAGQTKGQYIVFDIAGTIKLGTNYRFKTKHSYTTIDGSTAPFPGITFDTRTLDVNGDPYSSLEFVLEPTDQGSSAGPVHDIIVNNIRFLGPGGDFSKDLLGINASDEKVYNVIFDHCTVDAAGDGIFDIGGDVNNVTVSWNLITGTIVASAISGDAGHVQQLSVHHNVWALNSERQPKIKSESTYIDFVNNVCYGWSWIEGSGKGLQLEPFDDPGDPNIEGDPNDYPSVNIIGNYYYKHPDHGVDYWGLKRTNAKDELCIGLIYFEDNLFPQAEDEDYNTSAKLVIPEVYQVTTYGASTLAATVVPYVGTHYPTQEEQDLLSEISIATSKNGYFMSLSSTEGGSVTDPGEGFFPYSGETEISVEATADEYYYFVNWTGTAVDAGKIADPNAPHTTVEVDGVYTIQANFDTDKLTLTISSGSNGEVANPGEGIFLYDVDTDVPIIASPDEGYHFVSWTGTAVDAGKVSNPNSASTTVTIDADYTIQANFLIDLHTLTVLSTSGGSVTNPGEGTFSYDDGAFVSIQATASTNYQFVNWTGTAVDDGKVTNPNAASTTVHMDADYTLVANFALAQRTLTFSSTNGGSVTVPGEGDFQYAHGTFVAIRAVTESNYHFMNWTGSAVDAGKVANPNSASTTVTADADYSIQANFGGEDGGPPTVTNLSPAADDIQVPLNSLIILHVTDAGIGVDASSVTITLDGDTIYTGDATNYSRPSGYCYRTGTTADFTYVYQSSQNFDFDQTLTVTVNAADLGGMAMTEQTYSFTTEMRSFGQNKQVDPVITGIDKAGPATARDSSGNIWAVWHAGPVGSRDIYIAKLAPGEDAFGVSLPLMTHSADQSNPAIAIGTDDRLYVVWQDNRQAGDNALGQWDIYLSTSLDGATWSVETRVNDPNESNQINPAIVVDTNTPNGAHVVWQDDHAGHQDIYIASSSDGFSTKTVSQITNDPLDQTEPAIAVDSSHTIYVLWTDARNPANGFDIYGAASNAGPWTNFSIVSEASDQSSPAIATESVGSMLHMLWVDQTSGDSGIYYASSNGLPGSPLGGSNLVDDYAKGDGQFSPAIAVTGSTGNDLNVFSCWHDERDVSGSTGDTDIWYVRANAGSGTNVFIGDGSANSNQTEPAMGIDPNGHPYILWTDDGGVKTEIYFAAGTYLNPIVLASERVTPASLDVTVGTDPGAIADEDDFSVVLLAGTCPYDVNIVITEIENPPESVLQNILNGCDFGPSGLVFNVPVTMTIPYAVTGAAGTPTAYWYNSRTGALSLEGITNVEIIELTSSLHALRFDSTHLTPFFVMQRTATGGGGGGGGGCALSSSKDESIFEYFLPYGSLAIVMMALRWRDRRSKKCSPKTSSS